MFISSSSQTVKLIDFGSAQELPYSISTVRPDSLEFSAPEVIFEDDLNKFADLWSVGVLTYLL